MAFLWTVITTGRASSGSPRNIPGRNCSSTSIHWAPMQASYRTGGNYSSEIPDPMNGLFPQGTPHQRTRCLQAQARSPNRTQLNSTILTRTRMNGTMFPPRAPPSWPNSWQGFRHIMQRPCLLGTRRWILLVTRRDTVGCGRSGKTTPSPSWDESNQGALSLRLCIYPQIEWIRSGMSVN